MMLEAWQNDSRGDHDNDYEEEDDDKMIEAVGKGGGGRGGGGRESAEREGMGPIRLSQMTREGKG